MTCFIMVSYMVQHRRGIFGVGWDSNGRPTGAIISWPSTERLFLSRLFHTYCDKTHPEGYHGLLRVLRALRGETDASYTTKITKCTKRGRIRHRFCGPMHWATWID